MQIADFGLARARSHEPAFSAVGTMAYLPPEAVVALAGRTHQGATPRVCFEYLVSFEALANEVLLLL